MKSLAAISPHQFVLTRFIIVKHNSQTRCTIAPSNYSLKLKTNHHNNGQWCLGMAPLPRPQILGCRKNFRPKMQNWG